MLLLDEPLSNLDAHLRDEMRELILGIQRQLGITTIFVTHDQEEAVVLADRIALMFDGEVKQFDQPNAFYERPVSVQRRPFLWRDQLCGGRQAGRAGRNGSGYLYRTPTGNRRWRGGHHHPTRRT